MTTKNNLIKLFFIAILCSSISSYAQEANTDYSMAMVVYIDAKVGHEAEFEAAVTEHNETFHNEAPNKGWLNQIMSGSDAGTYAWVMAPCTFTDLDGIDLGEDHEKHWDNAVVPHIKKYGAQEYWKLNSELSYNSDPDKQNKFGEFWIIDLKRGDYYRFRAIMGKIVEAFENQGSGSIRVYDNQFNGNDGRDVTIIFDMENLAEMDMNNTIKGSYEEVHGEGSWETMLEEWNEITLSINSQLWRTGISK